MTALLEDIRERFLKFGIAVAIVLSAGTLGYTWIEGWPPFDALYMTVITLATVGYSETHELSRAGCIFTVVLIFSGIGVLTRAFSSLTAFIVQGELTGALRRRWMEKTIESLRDHFILCGASILGKVIIEELTKTNRPLVVIERDAAIYERLIEQGILAILGDPTEEEVLKRTGIARAKGLFAALSSDRDNAFVTLTARGLNPSLRIVTEQIELNVRETLLRSGASSVVNINVIGGLRMASEMVRPAVVSFLDHMLRGEGEVYRFEELEIPHTFPCVGKPLGN